MDTRFPLASIIFEKPLPSIIVKFAVPVTDKSRVVLCPWHKFVLGDETTNSGNGFTVTDNVGFVIEPGHPELSDKLRTEYVVEIEGKKVIRFPGFEVRNPNWSNWKFWTLEPFASVTSRTKSNGAVPTNAKFRVIESPVQIFVLPERVPLILLLFGSTVTVS